MALPPGAKARAPEVLSRLEKEFEPPYTFLDHGSPFQLLVAVILSAQCTDAMVNKVTPALFAKYPTPEKLAKAPRESVEKIIYRTGFYRAKARHVQETAQAILDRFGGEVPRTMAELMTLPGVARKTANVVQSQCFGLCEGICVDTHVGRVARRLGLTRADDPGKVERDLMRLYPPEAWDAVPYYFIQHGRATCDAKRPRCPACPLADLCPKRGVTPEQVAPA
ncbi:MAG TPA: endonuclease III [Candidatus Thermoplasmatota archaeon]|nr:endonuclease III [Candidatus Thermoplasmatota archaeon]